MQRRLPEYAPIRLGLRLIVWGTLAMLALPSTRAQHFSSESDPFESFSTLDGHVPSQNLLWQSTVKGYLSQTAKPQAKAQSALPDTQAAPLKVAERPILGGKKSNAPSPFSKWIAPRSTTNRPKPIPSADVTPTPDTPPVNSNPTASDSASGSPTSEGAEAGDSDSSQRSSAPILRSPLSEPSEPTPPVEIARRPIVNRESAPQRTPSRSSSRRIGEVLDQDRMPADDGLDDSEIDATPLNNYPEPQIREEEKSVETIPVELPPLTRNQKALREHVRRVLRYFYERPLNTRDRSPWEVMHCALSYEVHSRILQGGPQGKPVSAVGWLCFNQSCRRMKLMYVGEEGDLNVRVGPALQGHRGQLLAILAQANVSSEYPMLVDGHEFKIKDLIKAEMETCYPRTELTFKLIGLMHYLDSETRWVNDQGMQWNMRKLVTEELKQPIRGAACGGTHRLSGLTLAYKTRQARGESVDGEYAQAQRFVAQHQLYLFRTQNPDGSFSTNWFQGREDEQDIDRKLKTTGHMLEWLLYSSTDRELKSPRTTKAVYFLTNLMYQNRYRDWESGPLGHALHALLVYDRLMFSKYDEPGSIPMAIRDTSSTGARGIR